MSSTPWSNPSVPAIGLRCLLAKAATGGNRAALSMNCSMRPNFEDKLAFGREIEKAVGAWLMNRGQRILPVYDYSGLADGKAPRFTAAVQSESLVLPDLLGAKDGRSTWFEVKFKDRADFTHKTARLETGISKRLWDHYQKVEAESGSPVWLIFAHKQEDELRGDAIAALQETARVYDGDKMGPAGMVFFDYRALKFLAKLSSVAPFVFSQDPAGGTTEVSTAIKTS